MLFVKHIFTYFKLCTNTLSFCTFLFFTHFKFIITAYLLFKNICYVIYK